MAGREGIRQQIEYLKEQLAKTKSEKRKKAIREEIECLESGDICIECGPPKAWERNHPITGRKAKPKKEDQTMATRKTIAQHIEDLKEQIAKADSVDLMIDLRRKILALAEIQQRIKFLKGRLAKVKKESWKEEIREEIEYLESGGFYEPPDPNADFYWRPPWEKREE